MIRRLLSLLTASVALAAMTGAPAMATDTGTGTLPPAPPPSGVNATCVPSSKIVTSSASVSRTHLLRGTASDGACAASGGKVAHVSISVSRKHGSKCQFLSSKHKLGRLSSCAHPRWLSARGSSSWSFRMPKRLPHGSYSVSTRAVDSTGNVGSAHSRRLAIH